VTRFLIVRLGALGDIVHAIPVAAALRREHPRARIDWLVSGKHREILELLPSIDQRVVVRDRSGGGGASVASAIQAIRRTRYEVAIDLQGLIKSAMIARLSGAARVIGFNKRYARERLATMFYTDVHDPGGEGLYAPSEKRHVVEINLGLLRLLGIDSAPAEFPLAARPSDAAREIAEATSGRYALLNPGAAWPNKRWPPARLAGLAAALRDRRNLKSVILWGPGELELAEQVVASAGGAAMLSPQTSIADLVALARGAAVLVSGDTGPTHLAAAVGTPIVGIYGPTRPERNGPWHVDDETVSRADVCRCHHFRQCRNDRMCLLDVSVDDVLGAVERRLAAAERAHALKC
jgi:lipopolysaccharide heptosyltransferase I